MVALGEQEQEQEEEEQGEEQQSYCYAVASSSFLGDVAYSAIVEGLSRSRVISCVCARACVFCVFCVRERGREGVREAGIAARVRPCMDDEEDRSTRASMHAHADAPTPPSPSPTQCLCICLREHTHIQ